MITDNEFYYWSTKDEHSSNEETMSDFINNHLSDDYDVYFVDGTYAEMKDINGFCWAVHAGGDGDFRNHKVQFDAIGYR